MHRRLGSGELSAIAEKLFQGVPKKDRRVGFRMYKQTFQGTEAVEFFLDEGLAPHDVSAVELGQQLLAAGVIKQAVDSSPGSPGFKNSTSALYTFSSSLLPQASINESSPREMVLEEEDLTNVVSALRQGLVIKDRTVNLRKYKDCFEGVAAVKVLLTTGLATSEEWAVAIGNALMQEELIQHVNKNQSFKNTDSLYRFTPNADKYMTYNATPSSLSSRRSLDGSPVPTVSPSLRPLDSGPLTPPQSSDGDPFSQLITQSSRRSTEGADVPGPLPVALPSGGQASWAEGKSQASFITRGGTTLSGQAFEHSGRRQALDMVHLYEFQQPLNCCNITAIAFAIAALSVPTTVEDVFHYADLPAQMIIDAGLTLADTFQVACRYVEGRNLPFRVELFFFDEGRLSEQDFAEQVAEVSLRRAASSKDVEMYLLNFNVNIAHGIQEGVAIGGGHFALLGGWDTDGHLVIADVNPKKYLRYWRCTPNRMFRAMQDKDSTSKRSRGCIRITHKDNPYTNPWPQEAVWNPPGIHKGIAGVDERSLHAPIACGNVTAIAYALSAIGKKTSVDDIFHTAQLPLRAVTDGNMTLADTFHTMVEVVQTRQLPVKVEIYHMDDNKILPETFWRCMMDAVANQDTAVILNFDIDTALGAKVNITSHASGGEYALVAAVDKEKEEVILASVQPRSYARYWRCAVGRLFAACKKRDLSIGRGRGMIRVVSKTSNANQAPAPSRLNSAFVCEAAESALTAYNMAKMANSAERRASTYERRQSTLRRNLGIPRAPSRAQSRNLTQTDSMSPKVMSILGLEGDPSGAGPGGVPRVQSVRARPPEPMPSIMERPGRYDVPVNIPEEEDDDEKAAAGANVQPVDGLASDEEEEEDEENMVGEQGSDPVAVAEALGVYSGKPDRPFLFFTYGTLKQGFANRGQFEEALHDFVGPRVTKESLPLVVPTLPSCTNAGCRLLHRACTLLDAPGQGSGQVMGELYAIDKVTLDAFDILENFIPDDLANSSYIRKPTAICKPDGSAEAKCLMYYSAQTSQKLEEVDKGIASCVTEYTLDMAASQGYKRCCLMNYDHEGPHWHWDGPPPPKNVVAWDGPKANVLVGSAASSAADKLPALVEELLATGKFNVKVVPSENSRHFFRDGMRVLTSVLKEDDIYYDHHEWNFEYTFGMPVIARHLWLRDWADILIIAPMTCNTLGKICHGVGDNLLTSVVSAWEWKKKPFIAAPAMNSIMFDSPVCQRNLKTLTELGATVMGPRKARLSNGKIGVGAMTLIEDIVRFADEATTEATKLPSAPTLAEVKSSVTGKERWRLKVKALAHAMAISGWLSHSALLSAFRNAANSDKGAEAWKPVLASIRSMPRINFRSETGDTALHFAAGGEGLTSSAGEYIQGNGNVDAVKLLIEKGADVNAVNQYGFTPLHVAISNKLSGIVRVLLKSGADPLIRTIQGCPRPYVLAVEKQDPRTLACFVLWEEDDESRKLPEADEIEKEKAEGDAMVQMDADAVAIS